MQSSTLISSSSAFSSYSSGGSHDTKDSRAASLARLICWSILPVRVHGEGRVLPQILWKDGRWQRILSRCSLPHCGTGGTVTLQALRSHPPRRWSLRMPPDQFFSYKNPGQVYVHVGHGVFLLGRRLLL
jgi:hypothetical protein